MFRRCYHRGGGLYHHRNVSDEKVPGTNQTLTIVSRILLRADDPLAPIVSTELQFARCGWLGLLLPAVKAPPHRCHDNEILIGPEYVSSSRSPSVLEQLPDAKRICIRRCTSTSTSYIHLKPYRT